MYLMYYSEDGRLVTDEPLPSTIKVMTLPEFVERANSFGRLRGAKYWELHCDGLRIISKQEIPLPDINPTTYAVMTYGKPRAHAIPQPQQVPVGVRVNAIYRDAIKDAQDENS